MTAVTASTNRDKPKMVFAGVEAGAKIFVELNGESGAAAAVATKLKKPATFRRARPVAELRPYCMFHTERALPGAVCWPRGRLGNFC